MNEARLWRELSLIRFKVEKLMSAVDDLAAAVTTMTDAVNSAVTEIQTLATEIQTAHSGDDSAAVEDAVGKLNALAENLKGAISSAQTPITNPA